MRLHVKKLILCILIVNISIVFSSLGLDLCLSEEYSREIEIYTEQYNLLYYPQVNYLSDSHEKITIPFYHYRTIVSIPDNTPFELILPLFTDKIKCFPPPFFNFLINQAVVDSNNEPYERTRNQILKNFREQKTFPLILQKKWFLATLSGSYIIDLSCCLDPLSIFCILKPNDTTEKHSLTLVKHLP
jgi:hypothetical protein